MLSKTMGQTAHVYGDTRYAARSWTRTRRVIIKAEVVRHPGRDPKNNPRFVVTNLPDDPEAVYEFYCGRGDVDMPDASLLRRALVGPRREPRPERMDLPPDRRGLATEVVS